MTEIFFRYFYEKATDASPAYRCPIGVYDFHNNSPFFYLDQHSFVEDENSTEGYRDFSQEVITRAALQSTAGR